MAIQKVRRLVCPNLFIEMGLNVTKISPIYGLEIKTDGPCKA